MGMRAIMVIVTIVTHLITFHILNQVESSFTSDDSQLKKWFESLLGKTSETWAKRALTARMYFVYLSYYIGYYIHML